MCWEIEKMLYIVKRLNEAGIVSGLIGLLGVFAGAWLGKLAEIAEIGDGVRILE